jgi:colicin import membrane protein
MSESKEISTSVVDICEENYPAIYGTNSLDQFINKTKEDLKGLVFDLSTAKGRKECASQAAKVSSSKKAVENAGRAYLKLIKEKPKVIEKELRQFVESMDKLRDETRQPLTDWETEQAKIESDRLAAEEAEKLRVQKESDHEIAILMDEKRDREIAEAEAEKERQRIAYEAEITQKAKNQAIAEEKQRQVDAENARIAAQAKLEADRIAEQERKEKAAQAERDRIEAARVAEQQRKDNEAQAERQRLESERVAAELKVKQAEERAAQAIEQERQRVENERLEAERIKAENEKNRANVGKKRKEAKEDLINHCGLTEEQARAVVLAISGKLITNCQINY